MFFNENETIDELKCPKCNHIYIQPRQLPCKHSLCALCVEVSEIEAKCNVCHQVHSVPNDGFPIDEKLGIEVEKLAAARQEKLNQLNSKLIKIRANLV